MGKQIISIVIILLLAGAAVFLWWQDQKDVRELNKGLPEGVKVAKSFFGNEYKVVNKIDGYEFKLPKEWKGLEEIEYVPEREEKGYLMVSIEFAGKEGTSKVGVINQFGSEDININLMTWAEENFKTFGLNGEFSEEKIGGTEIIKIQENTHLVGMFVYFFKKDNKIYSITNGSEDSIKYIILNGKW